MSVLPALIGFPLVLVIPGWTTLSALAPLRRLDLLERVYLVLVCSAAVSGWLGLLLAQLGRFSLARLLALLLAYSLGMAGVARLRKRPLLRWPGGIALPGREGAVAGVITLLFVGLAFRPFELVLGPRDAAVYPATGAQIAHHGGIVIRDPLIADLSRFEVGEQWGGRRLDVGTKAIYLRDLLDVREREGLYTHFFLPQHPGRFFYPYARMPGLFVANLKQGTVVPQFYHLYPTWLAIGFSLLGLRSGLLMTPYLALLGGFGIYLTARRLFGRWIGLAGYLLLSLNGLQVWFARYSVSEGATQFLFFLAAWALLRLEEEEEPFWGLLAGAAFGWIGLVRVDFFFAWLLLLPFLVYRWVTHRFTRAFRVLLAALGVLAVHTFAQMLTLTWGYTLNSYYHRIQDWFTLSWLVQPFLTPVLREYFHGRTPVMQQPWRLTYELGLPLLALAGLIALRRADACRARIGSWLRRHRRRLLACGAAVLLLLAAYAYLVRPGILTSEVLRHPLRNRLVLEGYIGAPVPEGAQANLVRLGWYLSPLGIALGLAGAAVWILRAERRSAFFLLSGLFYLAFFTYELYGEEHHVYIMRRYVPVVLPFLSVAIALVLGELARLRRGGRLAGGILGAAMVIYLAYTGLPFYRHQEYQGALKQLEALAARFRPDDVLLLIDDARDTPFTVATPMQYLFERPSLVIVRERPNGALVEAQIRRWWAEGRRVFLLVGNDGGRLFLPHMRLQEQGRFELVVPEFEQLRRQKPHNAYLLRLPFGIYEPQEWSATGSPLGEIPLEIDLGNGGYIHQVLGFHQDELAPDGTTFCWTKGEGILRLPWPEGDATVTVTLRLAGGQRPEALGPVQVSVFLEETPVGTWTLGEEFATYTFALPAWVVPRREGGTVLLHVVSPAWRQVDYGLGGDTRLLGVQVDRVSLEITRP
ncbi:MAG: glycosyltransferase family 39 protein [Chloroflexia bacterium]